MLFIHHDNIHKQALCLQMEQFQEYFHVDDYLNVSLNAILDHLDTREIDGHALITQSYQLVVDVYKQAANHLREHALQFKQYQ